jgi:fucose permease
MGLTAESELIAAPRYRRDALTWAAFSALLAFGVLNAALGPALPYLRETEHISYLAGAFHQAAYAIGGGLAGLIAVRTESYLGRGATIRGGLVCAAVAGLGIGYGDTLAITVSAAFLVSLFGTSALVRVWAALADAHGERRTVAMAEGEVSVSLGGIVAPLLVAGLAATALTWRFSFVVGGLIVLAAALAMGTVRIPPPTPRPQADSEPSRGFVVMPTLVMVVAIVAVEFALSFWLASYLDDTVGLGRATAVVMVSGLYAANLVGRVIASHFARSTSTERLLAAALVAGLIGTAILLAAGGAAVAIVGIAVAGMGVGAMFPLTSSLHVGASSRNADGAIGQVLLIAALGQIAGPLLVGAIAQAGGLRGGLLIVPALILVAGAALMRHNALVAPRPA